MNDSLNIFVDFFKLFAIMFIVIHWVGCFFFAISSLENDAGIYNFINQAGLSDTDDIVVKYVTAIYFAF